MKVAEMARQLHVSRNTLYRKLKENNLDMEQLRSKDGQLTQYGMSVIAALFDDVTGVTGCDTVEHGTGDVSVTEKTVENDTESVSSVAKLSLRVAQLQIECDSVKRENDMLRYTLEDIKQQRDRAQEDFRRQLEIITAENARLITALEASQRIQQEQMQKLLPGTTEKRGFFAMLFGRGNKD